jgi:thioredoxin 2
MSEQQSRPTTAASSHILCPHCRSVNRVPADRPAAMAKCGVCHEKLFGGTATSVDEAGFAEHLRRNDIPVLVDMWAPWCGPCRTMTPLFERAAELVEPKVRLLRLNIDEAQATAARFGVRSIPALFLFQSGRVVDQMVGVQNTEAIVRWVRDRLSAHAGAQSG